jgi:hypothetical protein
MKKTVLHASSSHVERHLVNRPFGFPICFYTPVLLLHLSLSPPKLRPGWYGPYNAYLLLLCLIDEPDTLTTVRYQCSATPNVYVVAVTKEFVLPVHLNVCSDFNSDHLPILNDGACRAALQNYESSRLHTKWLDLLRIAPWRILWQLTRSWVSLLRIWTVQSSRLYFILTFLLNAINITILTL